MFSRVDVRHDAEISLISLYNAVCLYCIIVKEILYKIKNDTATFQSYEL